ncbi:MAG: cysteine--tRNA ligase [Pseudomonadota bacterium]
MKIYNSMTRSKQTFTPLREGQVGIYVCGLTVYDYSHIGHARMLVVFDMVVRHLRARGYDVTYVRNTTDIDDKIIARAAENGETVGELTERMIQYTNEDCAALGVLPPDHEPRATQHIDGMIAMIETLIDKGFAYQGANGDVFYAVSRFADYGKLSGKRLEDLRAGNRVDVDTNKRDPLDFVLWKMAKPGEPSWSSPWGDGRPGWHIECSAMSVALLGTAFDIHGGGMDLKFPHHENEIAQTCAACDGPFASLWMHNGFVNVDDEKMSKSLGNFFTVRAVLEHYLPEELRFFLLSGHYRSPINYSDKELTSARASLNRLYTALRGQPRVELDPAVHAPFEETLNAAMDDDFNTPMAFSVLHDLARHVNRARDAGDDASAASHAASLRALGARLGLLEAEPETYLKSSAGATEGADDGAVDALVAKRTAARQSGDWALADQLRDEIAALGVVLEDGPAGTTWRRS